jgi:hypothetical protein
MPFGIRLYFVKWRGWLSAGLPPQKDDQVTSVAISPSVHVTSPTPWNAMPDGPWHTLVVVSTVPPIASPMPTATRCASDVVSLSP